jgi:hypothetical protein
MPQLIAEPARPSIRNATPMQIAVQPHPASAKLRLILASYHTNFIIESLICLCGSHGLGVAALLGRLRAWRLLGAASSPKVQYYHDPDPALQARPVIADVVQSA